MAIDVMFDPPPFPAGSPEAKIYALYRHLETMNTKLNEAMQAIAARENNAEVGAASLVVRPAGQAQDESGIENRLKSLIVKNAEKVSTYMEEIRTELQSRYEAYSQEFGEYQRTVDTQITETAEGLLREYNIEERISGVETNTDEFINRIQSFIYSGILEPSDDVGIAIGTNVTNPDGTLNNANKMATFTSERLSFWINGVEAAYFSNRVFHISYGEIENELKMGRYVWKTLANGAMGLVKT